MEPPGKAADASWSFNLSDGVLRSPSNLAFGGETAAVLPWMPQSDGYAEFN